ncbi:hypothetical protein [Paraherbaspirillum soli]|uniref:Elongation factor Tu n=1 Tax=Paraherbaspirillum soli TaxID=631222 RepID=A0ABW0MAM4_9BURK
MQNSPKIIVRLKLYETSKEGGSVPILPPKYGCIVNIDDEFHDARIYISGTSSIEPGQEISLPMQFLWPDLVMPKVSIGKKFLLTEGQRKIGDCEVVAM